jgi:PAS domain S-box-containing protein
MSRTRRLWQTVVPAALGAAGFVSALVLTSDHQDLPVLTVVLGGSTGLSFVAAGLIARTRRPLNRTGLLLMAVGFAWLAAGLTAANGSLLWTIGVAISAVFAAFLVHLLLAYPTGELASRWERGVAVTAYVLAGSANVLLLLFDRRPIEDCEECPDNAFLVQESETATDFLTVLVEGFAVVFLLAVVVALVRRWRRSTPAARRALAPVLFAGAATLFFLGIGVGTQEFWPTVADIAGWTASVAFVAVPFVFLWGLFERRLARAALGPLMRTDLTLAEFQEELRRILRDPTSALLISLEERGGYIDAEGRPVELPDEGPQRAVTRIADEEVALGALVHDPALRGEGLLEDLAAALRLNLQQLRSTAALQASERRSRALLEALPDSMFRISREGVYLDFHAQDPAQLRLPPEKLIGSSVWDYPVPHQATRELMATAERAFETGSVQTFEFEAAAADGTVRYREGRVTPSGADEFLLVTRDITARTKAEQLLKDSEQRSRALLEAIPDSMFRISLKGRMLDYRVEPPIRLFRPEEGMIGSDVYDTDFPSEIIDRRMALGRRAIETGEVQTFEYELEIDGTLHHQEERISPSGDDEFVVIVRDITRRKRQEDELRVSEQRSRALLEAIPDLMFRTSRDGTFLDVHEGERRSLRPVEEVVGTNVYEYPLPRELMDRFMAAAETGFETGTNQTFEYELELEGEVRHQEARLAPIGDDEFFVMIRDVTDARRQEKLLERERDFVATVVNTAPTYFCVISESGQIVRFNTTLSEATGRADSDEVRRQRFQEAFVLPQEVGEFEERLELAHAEGDTGEFELRLRSRDGELLDVLWRGVDIYDEKGERRFLLCGLDVTERARHREDLERRSEFLSAVGDATPAFLCVILEDGRLTSDPINEALRQATGYTTEEAEGRRLTDLFIPPEDVEDVERRIASVVESGKPHEQESEWLTKDGRRILVAWTCTPLPTMGDETPYLISGVDVTERARQQEEQAALRRVAVAVASERRAEEVFDVVTEEVCRLLGAHTANLVRFEPGDEMVIVGRWSEAGIHPYEVGTRIPFLGGPVSMVHETGRPVRADLDSLPPAFAERLRQQGINSVVAAPITVSGRLWGAVSVSLAPPESFLPGSEERIGEFTRLVSLALANAEARADLAAQRARIVTAGDEARRRLERNLHDGAQQRLVSLSLSLRLAQSKLGSDPHATDELLSSASIELALALEELRELARGIHPAVLTERGLGPALESLADRATVPVALEQLPPERLPGQVEAAAYYVVSEALANVSKYAEASAVSVRVAQQDGWAVVEVEDDGVGGADPSGGSGLRGLADRVEALEGRLEVKSVPGAGTKVRAAIPLG